ncbi:MAG: hypothetical protein WCA35_15930 [Kovacikia sp.]
MGALPPDRRFHRSATVRLHGSASLARLSAHQTAQLSRAHAEASSLPKISFSLSAPAT